MKIIKVNKQELETLVALVMDIGRNFDDLSHIEKNTLSENEKIVFDGMVDKNTKVKGDTNSLTIGNVIFEL